MQGVTWVRSRYRGRAMWHAVSEIEHFRDEYDNGSVNEGDIARTLCKHAGGLLDNQELCETTPDGVIHEGCLTQLFLISQRQRFCPVCCTGDIDGWHHTLGCPLRAAE